MAYILRSASSATVSLADNTVIDANGLSVANLSASALEAITNGLITCTPEAPTFVASGVAADDIDALFALVKSLDARIAKLEQNERLSIYVA